MPTPAAHAVAATSCSVGTPASTATTRIASAKPCDSSITASSAWRRLWNPPRKSDSPHESEEPRASSAASTAPRLAAALPLLAGAARARRVALLALAATVEQLQRVGDQLRRARAVREHVDLSLARKPRDQ